MFCGSTSREIDVYLPRANKESNKIYSWESRGKGGGVHVFSLIREGGFEKLLYDLMGGCEKKVDFKKIICPPPPPPLCSIHNECSLTALLDDVYTWSSKIPAHPRSNKVI